MGTKNTSSSYWRYKRNDDTTAAIAVYALVIAFDPTAASAATSYVLPKGARVILVQSLGGATGGTNPTVDIGSAADPDGFANELDADGVSSTGSGALTGTTLSADTTVYAGVGASAATGGTTTVVIQFVMSDS